MVVAQTLDVSALTQVEIEKGKNTRKEIYNLNVLSLFSERYDHNPLPDISEANQQAKKRNDKVSQILKLLEISDAHLLRRELSKSERAAVQALSLARSFSNVKVLVIALATYGNVQAGKSNWSKALRIYQEALEQKIDQTLMASLQVNVAIIAIQAHFYSTAYRYIFSGFANVKLLPETSKKIPILISLGNVAWKLHSADEKNITQQQEYALKIAWECFHEAERMSIAIEDTYHMSYANGFLGMMYEEYQRYPEALMLTRKALHFSQQERYPQLLYRWQWQIGRILKQQGKYDQAIRVYRESLAILNSLREEFFGGFRGDQNRFRERIKPVYYQLAELFILKAEAEISDTKKQAWLRQAIDSIETLKSAELIDYFQDPCIVELKEKRTSIESIQRKTAILYPISLATRLILLVTIQGKIYLFSSDITSDKLESLVTELRKKLEIRTRGDFIFPANELYRVLFQPLEQALRKADIQTIVVVPDSIMQSIPFAAMYDGDQCLVERFSFAITPGFSLIDPQRIKHHDSRALLLGVSESIQGYASLPYVSEEISFIQGVVNNDTTMLNAHFTIASMEQTLKNIPYSIVHLATHGEFGYTPEESFLMTYDGKITMGLLERYIKFSQFRDQPIELLTLSGCRTVAGDERSAMGLAGVAIQSGARSALASLWSVSDQATTVLMQEFYRNILGDKQLSKAKALQEAKKSLLKDRRYRHPYYWSPFLLIGNWL